MTTFEGEQHVIIAAQHILKALGATKNLNDGFRRALMELDAHLSAMTLATEAERGVLIDIEERLKLAERKVKRWESNPSSIWDSPSEASEYLQAVHQVQAVLESLDAPAVNEDRQLRELADRAQSALQSAMSRLKGEVCHILLQNKQYTDPQHLSFRSCVGDMAYDESFVSLEEEIVEVSESSGRPSSARESFERIVDLVNPQVIPSIKSIANLMFASDYGREFLDAFIGNRKDALEEYLSVLELQRMSIEDFLKLDWESLDRMIKKWMWAMKNIVHVYLASEKRLSEQILGDLGSVCSFGFAEIAKDSLLYLFNSGGAMTMGPHGPEKLCRLLDMYEILVDLQPDMDALFLDEPGSFLQSEFFELRCQLGDAVKATFFRFKNAIASEASARPVPGGAIHPLNKYVMNYLGFLAEYHGTLGSILNDHVRNDPNAVPKMDGEHEGSSSSASPAAPHFMSITTTLEIKLRENSKLYRDSSPEHIFLMNNIHYMFQKVMQSDLTLLLGDEWIRKQRRKFQQHATSYWGVTWNSVVSLLRSDGKTSLKERIRRFTIAFDEVYKSQMQWYIPNAELREDQQNSAFQKVVHAYQSFTDHVDDKFLKYSVEDMGKLFLALFAEPPKTQHNSRKR